MGYQTIENTYFLDHLMVIESFCKINKYFYLKHYANTRK